MGWFGNYLSESSQCARFDGLNTCNGVTQGSVLGLLLFSTYINTLGQNVVGADFYFYADNTVICCASSSITEAVAKLQAGFNADQN